MLVPAAERSRAPFLQSKSINCTNSPDLVHYRKLMLAARLGSRALRKGRTFLHFSVALKRQKLFDTLNIRGILTPACALAQNDGSVGDSQVVYGLAQNDRKFRACVKNSHTGDDGHRCGNDWYIRAFKKLSLPPQKRYRGGSGSNGYTDRRVRTKRIWRECG